MMRFNPCQCPTCGAVTIGVWETVPGLALLDVDLSGTAEYAGETKIHWDGQVPDVDVAGWVTLECENGHQWQAEQLDDAPLSGEQTRAEAS